MDDSQCQTNAERVVLSTIFDTRNLRLIRILDEKDFTDPLHRVLLKAFKELRQRDAPLEQAALDSLLRTPDYENPQLKKKCGIRAGEMSMAAAAQLVLLEFKATENIEYYYRQIRLDRVRRSLLTLGSMIIKKAREKPLDPMDTLKWVGKQVARITKESGLDVKK